MPLKFTCPNCQNDIIIQYLSHGQIAKCRHCGAEVPVPEDAEEITTEQAVEYADRLRAEGKLPKIDLDRRPRLEPPQRRKVGFLRVIAWCILIGGVFVGLLTMIGGFALLYEGEMGTEGVGMGVGIIIQAVAIFGILLVIAMMAESLIDIQEKMSDLIKINRKEEES
jgi:ribosomal protein S27E